MSRKPFVLQAFYGPCLTLTTVGVALRGYPSAQFGWEEFVERNPIPSCNRRRLRLVVYLWIIEGKAKGDNDVQRCEQDRSGTRGQTS